MLDELATLLGPDARVAPAANGHSTLPPERLRNLARESARNYCAKLAQHDVGVPCGPSNGGLCALIVADLELLKPLLELNEILRTTAASDTPGGVVFWLLAGPFAPPQLLDWPVEVGGRRRSGDGAPCSTC